MRRSVIALEAQVRTTCAMYSPRTATLILHGSASRLEYKIVAFDGLSADAYRIEDGRAVGLGIRFTAVTADPVLDAINALTERQPNSSRHVVIDP